MANPDSFIDEVTEEVRRDRLFALFRRWAWLAVVIVLVLVGGAAILEYRRAQAEATAQAFGNAVITALDAATPAERIARLDGIEAPGPEGEILLALLAAGEAAEGEERAAAASRLRSAAEAPGLAIRYVHLALLKAHLLDPMPEAEARLVLGTLAEPGAPYAALAEEQLALLDIAAGDVEGGVERLRRLEIAADATAGLQQRAGQLIVALESGASLIDAAPEPASEEATEGAPAETPDEATGTAPETDTPGAEEDAGADASGAEEDAGADASGAEEDAGADAPGAEEDAGADAPGAEENAGADAPAGQ
jgi:hypothetical protein